MVDLRDVPLIDEHVHIFAPDAARGGFDPLATFTLGGDDPGFLEADGRTLPADERARLARNLEHTIAYQQAVCTLAGFLGCEPTREAVLAARAAQAADFAAYLRRLYADIRLEAVIVDMGHPADVDLTAFANLTNVPTYGIYRIEALIAELWDGHDDFEAFERAFLERLSRVADDKRVVALKSIIAYRTGLAVEPVTRADAGSAFSQLKRSPYVQGLLRRVKVPLDLFATVKRLRDYLLWRALELSIELSLPFQLHTGMGDQDLDIGTARPGLLGTVLRDTRLRHARIIMLHGSYPFYEEAAYLTNIFPNVFLDLSLFNPFIGLAGVTRVFRAILELAPFTKLLYASDAYGSPELQWVAGRNARAGLTVVLDEAVAVGMLTAAQAQAAARLICADNARTLYRL
jgi:uncharacterized protein